MGDAFDALEQAVAQAHAAPSWQRRLVMVTVLYVAARLVAWAWLGFPVAA